MAMTSAELLAKAEACRKVARDPRHQQVFGTLAGRYGRSPTAEEVLAELQSMDRLAFLDEPRAGSPR